MNKILNFREEPDIQNEIKDGNQLKMDKEEREMQNMIRQAMKEIENTMKSLLQTLSSWAA